MLLHTFCLAPSIIYLLETLSLSLLSTEEGPSQEKFNKPWAILCVLSLSVSIWTTVCLQSLLSAIFPTFIHLPPINMLLLPSNMQMDSKNSCQTISKLMPNNAAICTTASTSLRAWNWPKQWLILSLMSQAAITRPLQNLTNISISVIPTRISFIFGIKCQKYPVIF